MTRVIAFTLVIAAALSLPEYLPAQDDVPEMIADRPDVSESSQTVPRAYYQLETGFGFNTDRIVRNFVEVEWSRFRYWHGVIVTARRGQIKPCAKSRFNSCV